MWKTWGFIITGDWWDSGNSECLGEVVFRDPQGQIIPLTGGSAGASGYTSTFVPANAVDGDLDTFWLRANALGGVWFYTFPEAVEVGSYEFYTGAVGSVSYDRAPYAWTLVVRDDPADPWVELETRFAEDRPEADWKTYNVVSGMPLPTAFLHIGMMVWDSQNTGNTRLSEFTIRDAVGGPSNTTGGSAYSTSTAPTPGFEAGKAFDGDFGTWFQAGNGVERLRITYEYASAVGHPAEYGFWVDSDVDYGPKSWDFVASPDGKDWFVLDTQVGVPQVQDAWDLYELDVPPVEGGQDQPLAIWGITHTGYGLPLIDDTLQRPEFQGETLTELGEDTWVSFTPRWQAMLGVYGFEDSSAPHWVSRSPRPIFPAGEVHTLGSRHRVEKRELGGQEHAAYGRPFVWNKNQIFDRFGSGRTFTEHTYSNRVELGTRTLYASTGAPYTGLSAEALVRNVNRFVSQYAEKVYTLFGRTKVANRNRVITPRPFRSEEIPRGARLDRRWGQMLPPGEVQTEFGTTFVELGNRTYRMYGTQFLRVPTPRLEKTPMVYPQGEVYTEFGRATLTLPDKLVLFKGGKYPEFGLPWVTRGVRTVRITAFGVQTEFGGHRVRNAFEFHSMEGSTHTEVPRAIWVRERFNIIYPPGYTHTRIGRPTGVLRNRTIKAIGSTHSFTWPFTLVQNKAQHVFPTSILGERIGQAWVRDSLHEVFFRGQTHFNPGWMVVYTPIPIPVPELVQIFPPSLRRGTGTGYVGESNDAAWIGVALVEGDPRPIFIQGLEYDDISEHHEVSYLGSNADSLNLMTRIGEFNVFGGDYFHGPYGGDDPYTLYGQARFTPDRIYATNDIPTPNPYPGTAGWYPPDHAGDPDDVRMGDMAVDLKNRFRMAGAADQSLIPLGHQVAFPDPEPQGVFVQGQSQTRITNPYVGGGVREVFIVQLLDHAVYGEHLVGFPEPPAPLYYDIDFTGYGKDHSEIPDTGGFDNFDRPFRMAGVEPTNIIPDTHWVSRSPRHVPYQDDEVDYDWGTPGDTAEYGLAWASFYKRYFELGGGDQSWTLGFSPPNILNRTYVKNVLGEDGEIPVFPAGTEHSQIGAAFLSRGSICS